MKILGDELKLRHDTHDKADKDILDQIIEAREQEASNPAQSRVNSIIESLKFPKMSDREHGIAETAYETYDWILSEGDKVIDTDHAEARNQLVNWLSKDNGIAWLCGKAGTGKSTLMRFILQNDRTMALLEDWAGGRPLFIAVHYFWYPSSETMQSSYNGFLQHVLYQVLNADTSLTTFAFPTRMQSNGPKLQPDWSRRDLTQALTNLGSAPIKLCLFLDGLDECNLRKTTLRLSS